MKNSENKSYKLPGLSVLILVALLSTNVLAHNSLKITEPADGSVMHEAPQTVSLSFSDSTYLMALEVKNEHGLNVLSDFTPGSQAARSFSTALPENLDTGVYTVIWMVVGDDTHEIKGEFSFTLNAMASEKAGMNHEQSAHEGH